MEMEAPRRSALDRLRELSTKKPRLSEDSERERNSSAGINSDRSRPYAQARSAVGGNGGNTRFRASEREDREEVGRGGVSYQQQQELVAQYRTALAELTFNSKPIITNLTIIAGENLHSAKAIAGTVCENVLEVPSEQKLPSLYLLDSIVKNIGSDYIKYFAARLPHVFCKAYKQVDPSIHHSLWHLFRTWKGVFPPSCLQSIENELGFQNLLNGSSGGTGTRPDAQAQKAPHSIHVNPKYLEARQRLQQSAKGKEISNEDIGEEAATSVGGTERPIRTTSTGTTRQWSELSNKNAQLPQREQPSDFINERQGYKETRESRFSSSKISQQQDIGVGRLISRGKELDEVGRTADQINDSDEPNKPYFEASGAYRQNGLDADHAYGGYSNKSSGPASNNSQLPSIHLNRTKWPLSKNWKTSEEEEYIWDDVRSRSTDYEGVAGNKSNWSTEDPEKPIGLQDRKWFSLVENEQAESRLNKAEVFQLRPKIPGTGDKIHFPRDYVDHYSQHNSQEIEPRASKSSWPLPLHDTSLPALGLDSNKTLRDSGQTERRPTSFVSALSAKDSSGMPRTGFQSALPSSLGSSLDVQGSGGILGHQRQLPIRSPSPTALPSVPPAPPLQQQKLRGLIDQDYLPSLSSQIDQKSSEPVDFSRDPFPLPVSSDNPSQNTSLNSQPYQFNRDLQAVRSEALASASQGFKGSELKGFPGLMPVDVSGQSSTNNLLAAILKSEILSKKPSNIHPPLPSGPPPTQALASTAPLPTSSTETMTPSPLIGGMLPPLPPGPPPSSTSAAGASSQAAGLNPLSSLLSSLVAKGLITSASSQLPTFTSSQVSKESSSQNSDPDRSTSTLLPPSLKELPTCDPLAESDNMIGLQFKTEVIREFHPSVIDSLRLGHHGCSDWHRSINSEIINGVDRVCRRWYSQADNWVSDEVERSCGPAPTPPSEEPLEPMVAADESQCICAFCGEPFEDFYSVERDEWMYRGTVYLNSTDEKCVAGEMQNRMDEGPIVHAKCISALPLS